MKRYLALGLLCLILFSGFAVAEEMEADQISRNPYLDIALS